RSCCARAHVLCGRWRWNLEGSGLTRHFGKNPPTEPCLPTGHGAESFAPENKGSPGCGDKNMKPLHCLPRMLLAVAGALTMQLASAADLHLEVGTKTTLTTQQLLARPDAKTIQVPGDVSYQRTMSYRAVPLRALPGIAKLGDGEDLQIVASDGFVTNLP